MKWFKCCYCGETLNEGLFYKDLSRETGRKPRCKSCEKLYKNIEQRRLYEKDYRAKHPEKRRAIMRHWYEINVEQYKITQKNYRSTEQFRIKNRNTAAIRRARIKSTEVGKIDFLAIYNESPFCFYCKKPLSIKEVEFDHYIPISRGGPHTSDNIRVSCMPCNRRKGAMTYQVV